MFLTEEELYQFRCGNYLRSFQKMGAHPGVQDARAGVFFSVWAPNAVYVSVVGDFNDWDRLSSPFEVRSDSGVWQGFVPGAKNGDIYKFFIQSRYEGYEAEKADPYAFQCEIPPLTASRVWDLSAYHWNDDEWLANRKAKDFSPKEISVCRLDLDSLGGKGREGSRVSYRQLRDRLPGLLKRRGFVFVEFPPLMEYFSEVFRGRDVTGFYTPSGRYGAAEDLMWLVDGLHQAGVGVIMRWPAGSFSREGHGLSFFDGTYLYEHADWRKRTHAAWGTCVFNHLRFEVANFLLSNALFWFETYHIDGLCIHDLKSLLYLDHERGHGQWMPNSRGGREDLEATAFLKRLNETMRSVDRSLILTGGYAGECHGTSSEGSDCDLGFSAVYAGGSAVLTAKIRQK